MLDWYQNLPNQIDPVALSLGDFSLRWYGLMYLVGLGVIFGLLKFRIKKKEGDFSIDEIFDFLFFSMLGLIFGARLGYVFWYDFSYFSVHPLAIFSPLDEVGNFSGIFGMSYYGGLVGVILGAWIFCWKRKVDFWKLADFVVPAIPAGYFFGRLGNFLNGELFGREIEKWWGMYFENGGDVLRHPSQLYEAFLEGLFLFFLLWFLRNKKWMRGKTLFVYLIGYGVIRFIAEFFREPGAGEIIWENVMRGQVFSVWLIIISISALFLRKKYFDK